jgi:hypothetical protein
VRNPAASFSLFSAAWLTRASIFSFSAESFLVLQRDFRSLMIARDLSFDVLQVAEAKGYAASHSDRHARPL